MINKVFSILTQGSSASRKTERQDTPSAKKRRVLEALVPSNAGPLFRDLAAEQLVQCVRRSSLRGWLREFDPESLYDRPLTYPGVFSYQVAGGLDIEVNQIKPALNRVEYNFDIALDYQTNTIYFKGDSDLASAYTVVDGLSEPLNPVPCLAVVLKNPPTSGSATGALSCVAPFERTIIQALDDLPLSLRDSYNRSEGILETVAALVRDICEVF